MSENRFWNLLSKKFSGDASAEELQELHQILRDHPEFIYSAEQIEGLWKLNPSKPDAYDSELAFEQHLSHLKANNIELPELETPLAATEFFEPRNPRPRRKLVLAAASLVLLCLAGFFAWRLTGHEPAEMATAPFQQKNFSEVSTKPGSKTKLVLPDSTVVWLNSGSKLSYSEDFGVHNRNTRLTGEAFFDVKKSSIPFIIQTKSIQIKVLGTAFNVRSYPNEKTTETSLIRGRVEIILDKRPGEKYILKPNEKLTVANDHFDKPEPLLKKEPIVLLSGLTRSEKDNSIIETSWVENKLVFHDESFEDVARKMERWYNVEIEIRDEKLAQMHVGGGPFENENIEQALTALQIAFNFKFSIKGNHIVITR